MALPQRLDTFVTDDLIFQPQIGIHREMMDPAIIVTVIDRQPHLQLA